MYVYIYIYIYIYIYTYIKFASIKKFTVLFQSISNRQLNFKNVLLKHPRH